MTLLGESGVLDWLEDAMEDADTLAERMDEPLHEDVLEQMREADIPVASGDLEESLTDPSSPLHVWSSDADGVSLGSLARAAMYNPGAVPEIDVDRLTEVVVEAFNDAD